MASSREYENFILDQLSETEGVTSRRMMGELLIYCRGKIAGGIFDNRFLVKPVEAAKRLMPEATYEIPYPGAKEMLLVDNVDDRQFLARLFDSMYDELPEPGKKKTGP